MLRENEVLKSELKESNILNKRNDIDLKSLNNTKDEKPTFINRKTERNYDTSKRRLVFKKSLKGSRKKFSRKNSNSTIQIPQDEVKELTDKFNQELNYVKSNSKDSISLDLKVSTKTCETVESSNKNRKQIFKIVPFSSEINTTENRRDIRPLTKPCIICRNSYFYQNEYFKFFTFSDFLQGIKTIFEERQNLFTNENLDKLIKLYELLNYKRNDEVFLKNKEKWYQIVQNYNNTKNAFKRSKRFCKKCIFMIIEKDDCISILLDAVHEEDEQAILDNSKKEEILKNISSYFNQKSTKKLMFKPIINKPVDSFNIFDKVFSCEIKEKLRSKSNEIFKELNLNNSNIFNDKTEKISLPIKTKDTKSEQNSAQTDNGIKELIKCICSQYDSLFTLVKNQNIIINTCLFLLDQYASQKKTLNNLLDNTLVNIYDTIMKLTNLNKVLLYQQAFNENPNLVETFDNLTNLENLKNVNNSNFNVFDNAIKLMKVICKTIANNYIFE